VPTILRSMLVAALAVPLVLASLTARAADDVVSTAGKAQFTTLVAAIEAAGLVETLKGKGPFTVFAPSNAAFDKLPAGTLDMLLKPENKKTLAQILTYHVLPGEYPAERLLKARAPVYTVKTAGGVPVTFDKRSGLTIDGAKIEKTDIPASNGTIHVIDTVILPKSVKKALAAGKSH